MFCRLLRPTASSSHAASCQRDIKRCAGAVHAWCVPLLRSMVSAAQSCGCAQPAAVHSWGVPSLAFEQPAARHGPPGTDACHHQRQRIFWRVANLTTKMKFYCQCSPRCTSLFDRCLVVFTNISRTVSTYLLWPRLTILLFNSTFLMLLLFLNSLKLYSCTVCPDKK